MTSYDPNKESFIMEGSFISTMRIHKHRVVIGLFAVLVVLGALAAYWAPKLGIMDAAGSPGSRGDGFSVSKSMMAEDAIGMIAPAPGMPIAQPEPLFPSAGQTAAEVEARIIKTGDLHLMVRDVGGAAARITEVATARGGYAQASSFSERPDGTHAGTITVRVAAAEFDQAMAGIRAVATVVKNESVHAQDVTEQFTDLQARLRNAKAQEAVYLDILARARTVEDILKVQERLGAVRSDIESLEGRIKYLTNVTAYSTISAFIEEEPMVRAPTKEFRPASSVREAVQTLVELLQRLAVGLIWATIVGGGVLLPLAVLAWIIRAVWRHFRD